MSDRVYEFTRFRGCFERRFLLLIGLPLLVLPFGACSRDKEPAKLAYTKTLISQARPSKDDNVLDEKALLDKMNAASGKEKLQLMGQLADRKVKEPANVQEPLLQQIAAQARESCGDDSVELAEAFTRQGRFYFSQKEYSRSAEAWKKANNIYASKGEAYSCKRIPCVGGQIAGECANGKCVEEVELYKQLVELRCKCLGENNVQTRIAIMLLAETYSKKHQYPEALKLFTEVAEKSKRGNSDDQHAASLNVARTYIYMKDYKKAEPMLRENLHYAETHERFGWVSPLLVVTLKAYLLYYDRQKDYKNEVLVAKRILDLNEKRMGSKHPQLTSSLMPYADALEKVGKIKESEAVRKRIRDIELASDAAPPLPVQAETKGRSSSTNDGSSK